MTDREAFEAWWISCFPIAELERGVDDRYIVRDTEVAWQGWQAKSAREVKIVRDLIAQSDRDPFMTVGHFVEHCCDAVALAFERAKQNAATNVGIDWANPATLNGVLCNAAPDCDCTMAERMSGHKLECPLGPPEVDPMDAAPPAVQAEPVPFNAPGKAHVEAMLGSATPPAVHGEPVALDRWGIKSVPGRPEDYWFEKMPDGYWTPWHLANEALQLAAPPADQEKRDRVK